MPPVEPAPPPARAKRLREDVQHEHERDQHERRRPRRAPARAGPATPRRRRSRPGGSAARRATSNVDLVRGDRRGEEERRRLARDARDGEHNAGEDAADRGREHDRGRVRQRVTPSARLASRRLPGTSASTSCVARATIGSIRIASANAPARALWPCPTTSSPEDEDADDDRGDRRSSRRARREERAEPAAARTRTRRSRRARRSAPRSASRIADDRAQLPTIASAIPPGSPKSGRGLREEAEIERLAPLSEHGAERRCTSIATASDGAQGRDDARTRSRRCGGAESARADRDVERAHASFPSRAARSGARRTARRRS